MLCKLHVSICKDHHIFAQQIQKGNETGCQAYRQTDRPSHCANAVQEIEVHTEICIQIGMVGKSLNSNLVVARRNQPCVSKFDNLDVFFKYWYKFNFLPICSFLVVRVTSIN